jgi:hypothetical protein
VQAGFLERDGDENLAAYPERRHIEVGLLCDLGQRQRKPPGLRKIAHVGA